MTLALLGGSPVRTRPFAPWPDYDRDEETALIEVLRSRAWGGYHECIKAFETAFAAYHQVPHAVSCSNGTVALEVALRALGVGPGDEVIVPPYTFVASASSILLCGATPVFADIDPVTCNLSPAAAESAITPRTRAIVVVHFGGHPADMTAFQDLAHRHRLAIVEDSAHAHGARWCGVPVGGWGDLATFSFQSFKLMTAGEGGIILGRSAELIDKCWSYCNQGRSRDGGWFDHFTLGTNYRMTAFQAAVLNAQLRRMPKQASLRAENVAYFREQLKSFDGLTLAPDDPRVEQHPYYLLTLRYHPEGFSGADRDSVLRALAAEGMPFKPTYPHPLYKNPVFTALDDRPGAHAQVYGKLNLPEAERVCRDGVWLSHTVFLGDRRDIDDVMEALHKVRKYAPSLQPQEQTAARS